MDLTKEEIIDEITQITSDISDLQSHLKKLNAKVKFLKKNTKSIITYYEKKSRKGKKKKRKPPTSGINSKQNITPEMCEFLKVPHGTKMARTLVTTKINQYIKKKNLQNPENRKMIVIDETLASLLHIEKGKEITFFDLPRFMNVHFIKKIKVDDNN
jgi:chromatin remodeling complex protein RSC6